MLPTTQNKIPVAQANHGVQGVWAHSSGGGLKRSNINWGTFFESTIGEKPDSRKTFGY